MTDVFTFMLFCMLLYMTVLCLLSHWLSIGGRFDGMRKFYLFVESFTNSELHVSYQKVTEGSWRFMSAFLAWVSYGVGTELATHPSPFVARCFVILTVIGSLSFSICVFKWKQGSYVLYAYVANGCYMSVVLLACFYHLIEDSAIYVILASFLLLLVLSLVQWYPIYKWQSFLDGARSFLQTRSFLKVFNIFVPPRTSDPANPDNDPFDAVLNNMCKDGFQVSAGVGLGYFSLAGKLANAVQKNPHAFAYLAVCNGVNFISFFVAKFFRKGMVSRVCLLFGFLSFHSMVFIVLSLKKSPGYEFPIILATFVALLVFERSLIKWLADVVADKLIAEVRANNGPLPVNGRFSKYLGIYLGILTIFMMCMVLKGFRMDYWLLQDTKI